jgi:hypothetical protein
VVIHSNHCRATYLPSSPKPKCPRTPRSYATLWPLSNNLGGLVDRMGAKGEGSSLIGVSTETTNPFELICNTK